MYINIKIFANELTKIQFKTKNIVNNIYWNNKQIYKYQVTIINNLLS